MLTNEEVFEAIRRGYNDLANASDEEIIEYFEGLDEESLQGHISNIKGILFEEEYVDFLSSQGIDAEMFEETNHPISDIAIYEDGEVVEEIQLKATDSVSYINETLAENPDIAIVTTSEVASKFEDNENIIDGRIENEELTDEVVSSLEVEDVVSDSIAEEVVGTAVAAKIGLPIGIGWLIGLPF